MEFVEMKTASKVYWNQVWQDTLRNAKGNK